MKVSLLLPLCLVVANVCAQQPDRPQRGPYNTLPGGVVDGVAIQEEVPVRTKVDYEYVRASDVTWQKRIFSRIDAREKLNHDIFFPVDQFDYSILGSEYDPKSPADIDNQDWRKHDKRWSLWTIIQRHIMLGDLTVYRVNSEVYEESEEDGYSLKYPIQRSGRDDYFNSETYRNKVNQVMTSRIPGEPVEIYLWVSEVTKLLTKTDQSYRQFYDSVEADNPDKDWEALGRMDFKYMEERWNAADVGTPVLEKDNLFYLNSAHIVAYNIKEDWYFDKERSILDRRIIAIAPVARYKVNTQNPSLRGKVLLYDNAGIPVEIKSGRFERYQGEFEEREMFWLYFDELRDVIVNYYVYNDKNDAQWMSFDDLFWKRKFSSTIYRASDKFDREIEDYKFGVDALYESERIKESLRNWEQNLWQF